MPDVEQVMATSQERAEASGFWPPLHRVLGLCIERDGSADSGSRVVLPLGDHARGAVAPLHGGVLATLIDVACATAIDPSSYDPTTRLPVSLDLSVRYFRQPKSSPVVAEARVINQGSKLIHIECDVTDAEGRLLAHGGGSYMMVDGFGASS
jgi:uncharacterized protein (TIGR00369 family)